MVNPNLIVVHGMNMFVVLNLKTSYIHVTSWHNLNHGFQISVTTGQSLDSRAPKFEVQTSTQNLS
jgi:hypothetical protein